MERGVLRALAEIWPQEAVIYINELPGVAARGVDFDAAVEVLADVVEHHLAWLASHGFSRSDEYLEIEIAEQRDVHDGTVGALFDADREPATHEYILDATRVALLARRDLIDLYRSMSAFRRERMKDDPGNTIGDHLHDLARRDIWHAAMWTDIPLPVLPADPVRALQAGGAFSAETLVRLGDHQRSVVLDRQGELWTAGKSIRRQVAHLRHSYFMVRDLASR